MEMPFPEELENLHLEATKKLEALQKKYPNAKTDDFQKTCLLWEMQFDGRGMWIINSPSIDIEKTMDKVFDSFGHLSGIKAGIAVQAISDKPNGPPTGFQVACYEQAKDIVKADLDALKLEIVEIDWMPESEVRKQFEEWKAANKQQIQ